MNAVAAAEKPPQEKKSRHRRSRRRNRSLSHWCFKEKSRSRYDFVSGVPMFSNGAITAAFVQAFNEELHPRKFKTEEEAIDAQLDRARAEYKDINGPRDQFGMKDGYRKQPVGGFVYEESEYPFGFGDKEHRIGLQVDVGRAWGKGDAWTVGTVQDSAGLAVYTEPGDREVPDFHTVSEAIKAPVYVQHPNGNVYRYFDGACIVYRGDGSC